MKKNMFFWIMALMICAAVGCTDNTIDEPKEPMREKMSHEVTQAEARKSLEQIASDLKLPSTRGGEQKSLPPITSVYTTGKPAEATRSGEAEPYFHIFNFGDNEGFAIMSGDDRVEPLLALTFKGELTPETVIDDPCFELTYSRMEDYYVAKTMGGPSIDIDIPIPPRDSIALPDPIDTYEIADLPMGPCTVEWGQAWPYNNYCIMYPENEPAYTGCAATAIAQLMSIHKHPSSYHYYPRNTTYYFDWDEMNLYTSNKNTNTYRNDSTKYNQIARLMELLGEPNNLCVTYQSSNQSVHGSSSPAEYIPRTISGFGYSSGGVRIPYDTDVVIPELLDGYPVLLGGVRDGYGQLRWLGYGVLIRHSKIAIRYDLLLGEVIWSDPMTTYYVYCNWGNNGINNGYFLSGVFDPTDPFTDHTRSGENLPYNLDAFINIRR